IRGVLDRPGDIPPPPFAGAPAERAVRPRQGRDRACPGDRRAVVDLVALELRARLAVGNAYASRGLAGPQLGLELEQPEALRLAAALDALRIAHAPAEHLQPAADAQHGHACRRPPGDRAGDAGGAQP